MIDFLQYLLVSIAHAQGGGIDAVGAGAPGVDSMWSQIRATFGPYNTGAGLLTSIAMRIQIIVQTVVGTAAVIAIVYAGIQVATSGNEDKISEAKKIIMYALGGLIIVMLAPLILTYMKDIVIPLIFS